MSQSQDSKCVSSSELLAAVVRKHYNAIENVKGVDGAQMWNGQWWMPISGCDTLANLLDDLIFVFDNKEIIPNLSNPNLDP